MLPAAGRSAGLIIAAAMAVLVPLVCAGMGQAAAGAQLTAQARLAVSGRTWHTAQAVPGIAALSKGQSQLASVSCAAAGYCGAGGWYTVSPGHVQAFVVSEVSGIWRRAVEVPGTAALNRGGSAQVAEVSCPRPGNCGAGGWYTDSAGHQQAFVASQVNGTWRTAREVPGTAALNKDGYAATWTVSCAAAGNCSAGGAYVDGRHNRQAFVANEVNGVWRSAIEVPGTAVLNKSGFADVYSVSCKAAGNCSAGGDYADGGQRSQAFVVTEVNGAWHRAVEAPGTARLNVGGGPTAVDWVSCGSAGNCSADGTYTDSRSLQHPFVINQVNGVWHAAVQVPGFAALNNGVRPVGIGSVSCPSAGNCSLGGSYNDSAGHAQVWVASEVHGAWHSAIALPGLAALNQGHNAWLYMVSCGSAGNCAATGFYAPGALGAQSAAFVANEVNGTWQPAEKIPGTAATTAAGFSLSCSTAGTCSAGGWSGGAAFVVNKS